MLFGCQATASLLSSSGETLRAGVDSLLETVLDVVGEGEGEGEREGEREEGEGATETECEPRELTEGNCRPTEDDFGPNGTTVGLVSAAPTTVVFVVLPVEVV